MYRLMWNSSSELAMPANSAITLVMLAEHEQGHHEKRQAQAELFADEVGEALARDGAHARAHFLRDDENQGDGQEGPEREIAVFRASGRVGVDTAGIVVDHGGDKTRPKDREEDQQVIAEAAQEFPHPSLCLNTDMMSSAVMTPASLAFFVHHG